MKILVAYGSKRGGTEGLAQMLAQRLVARGADVVVEPDRTTTVNISLDSTALVAEEVVVAGAAVERVGPVLPQQRVVATVAVERVRAVAAAQFVVAAAASAELAAGGARATRGS